MKILSAVQIREADSYTIANEPIKSIDLMERAATACFEWIIQHFDKKKSFKIFCGIGNNGGDGLVIARKLFEKGYDVEAFIIHFSDNCSQDFLSNEKRLKNLMDVSIHDITSLEQLKTLLPMVPDKGRVQISNPLYVNNSQIFIDAIFGTGLSRPLSGFVAGVVREINLLSQKYHATVISIDIPSGLFCENNTENIRKNIILALYTLTFELPKLAFLFPENEENVGEWSIIPIGLNQKFIDEAACKQFFVLKNTAGQILKPRKKFSHKGTFGHALLICGSYGKMGAAVLAARACLRAGAGLTTVHIPACGYGILQTAVPEAMVSIDESQHHITQLPKLDKYNAIGIGPGIGTEKQIQNVLKLLIQNSSVPLVLDADAINIIAENKTWLEFIPKKSIFTPHHKEFERLVGTASNDYEKMQKQIAFAKKFSVYIILKGAHTCIACPDGEIFFNSSGNPGMATGGSGDALTGILTGLLAQGYFPKQACILGVYIHGLAGDIAAEKLSQEALLSGDIIDSVGEAFLSLSLNMC